MAFLEYYSELTYRFPTLTPFLAQRFVNRARSDIYRQRRWSFLIAEGVLTVPEAITTGTVALTQHSATVTPNAAAIAALNAAGTSPLVGRRQLSLGAGNPVYNILTYNGATIILDRPYREDIDAAASYQIFSCYYDPPETDFAGFITVRDIVNSYNLRLTATHSSLNRMDPRRATTGDPLYVVPMRADAISGEPRFELWPHPTTAKSYICLYQRRGIDWTSDNDALPAIIPESLLINRACFHAYQWAMQTGQTPNGKAVDWRFLMAQSDTSYRDEMRRTAREDNEIFMELLNEFSTRTGYLSPIDSNYAQNHAVDWSY